MALLTAPQPSPGIYHLTAEGACSWAEFAAEAFALSGVNCRVIAVDRKGDYGRIRRPAYSVLANIRGRALGIKLPHWKDDLARYLQKQSESRRRPSGSAAVSAADPPLNCGAATCTLDHGARRHRCRYGFHPLPDMPGAAHSSRKPHSCDRAARSGRQVIRRHEAFDVDADALAGARIAAACRASMSGSRTSDAAMASSSNFSRSADTTTSQGIEPDALRARNARKRGVPVFTSREEAESAGLLKEPVEVLFVWHVLEHIDRPAEFIEEYSRWLAPSGVMVISVPNQGSVQTRLFGYFSAYPDYGRHIWYHTADYLDWFVQNAPGLDAKILLDRNYEYEIFSWVDSIASAITAKAKLRSQGAEEGRGWADAAACCRVDGAMLVAAGDCCLRP